MINPCTRPVSNGAPGDLQYSDNDIASQHAQQDTTPCADAPLSSMCSLASPSPSASPRKHDELQRISALSSRHLKPLLMASVGNESSSHVPAVQNQQLNHGTKALKRHTCNECTKSYAHAKNLREHKAKHRNKRYSCDICGESVAEKRNLSRHIRLKHRIRGRLMAASTQTTAIDPGERSQEETA